MFLWLNLLKPEEKKEKCISDLAPTVLFFLILLNQCSWFVYKSTKLGQKRCDNRLKCDVKLNVRLTIHWAWTDTSSKPNRPSKCWWHLEARWCKTENDICCVLLYLNGPTCKGVDLQRVRCDHVTETERISVITHRRAVGSTLEERGRLAAIHQLGSREHKSATMEKVW